jgi:hypothetical protein
MISWRMELTVLTDLSASMLASCFLILLVFLGLAQERDRRATAPQENAIEASEALRIVRQQPLTSAGMVELLRSHGRENAGPGIDLFDDRIEVSVAGGARRLVFAPAQMEQFAETLPRGAPVRLYVFSNALYSSVSDALDRLTAQRIEMTVPRALRDVSRPNRAWSAAFLDLGARPLDAAAFRRELAALLAGAEAERAGASATPSGAPPSYPNLLDRLRRWLSIFTTIFVPLLGLAVVLWIERRRFRTGGAGSGR